MAGEHESFADYVGRIRVERKLSLEDVRRESGLEIAASYVNKIENDEINPSDISLGKLLSLAKGLGVEPDEVIDAARGISRPKVEITEETLRDREERADLMRLLFTDVPDDCQLDSLASMLGLHARRGRRLKIHQRSAARSAAHASVASLIKELLGHPKADVTAPQSSSSAPPVDDEANGQKAA